MKFKFRKKENRKEWKENTRESKVRVKNEKE
jgi:hypothetical protein